MEQQYTFRNDADKLSLLEGVEEVGYVTYPKKNEGTVRITHTFVSPSKRGLHLGDILLERLTGILAEKNLKAVLVCPFSLHYFSLRPSLSHLLSLDEENFKIIRTLPDPLAIMEERNDDSHYLFLAYDVERPFGLEETQSTDVLVNPSQGVIKAFFIETFLRQTILHDFCNGDAIPSLQSESAKEILETLIEGSKDGEIEGFHGGRETLLALFSLITKTDMGLRAFLDGYETIRQKASLNLTAKLYLKGNGDLLSAMSEEEKKTLERRLHD